ncbi:MAG: hypothetical protein FJ290_26020 [Planctomycetes bacterium]|nr:hypothetical protein [Planctomycetota bacterium]
MPESEPQPASLSHKPDPRGTAGLPAVSSPPSQEHTAGQASRATLGRRRSGWVTVALVAAIVAAGGGLRFCAIGRKSLWLDEAATMNAVDARLPQVFSGVYTYDAHPPLYYLALHTWMSFANNSRSGAWARAFSAAVGVATLVVFYFLARALLPRNAALVAAGLLAASAYHVYFAQEARLYALAAFFVVVSWCCLAHLVAAGAHCRQWARRHRLPLWLGLALANTAALYTFYYTAFSILAQGVALLVLWKRAGRKMVLDWALWQSVPLCTFALWVPVVLERIRMLSQFAPPAGQTILSGNGLSDTAAQFTWGFLADLLPSHGLPVRAVAALVGLLVVALAFLGLRRERAGAVMALTWLLAPVAFLAALPMRGHIYEPKHLFFASPALALAAGVVWSAARTGLRPLAAVLLAGILAGNAVSLAYYYRPGMEKENWRGAVAEFARRVEPMDMVTCTPPQDVRAFRHYYPKEGEQLFVETPPLGRPFRAGELRTAALGNRRVWVFWGMSNVEPPNPMVFDALKNTPVLFEWSEAGLVGLVGVRLYDVPKLPPKAK